MVRRLVGMNRRALVWGALAVGGLACSRAERGVSGQPSPSASVLASASAAPARRAPVGSPVRDLRWSGLRADRPLSREDLAHPECRAGVAFDLVAGDDPTAFSAHLRSESGQVEQGWSAADRELAVTLSPGERRRVRLGPTDCRSMYSGLFAPKPDPLTLTVQSGERRLRRSEVHRQLIETGAKPAPSGPAPEQIRLLVTEE